MHLIARVATRLVSRLHRAGLHRALLEEFDDSLVLLCGAKHSVELLLGHLAHNTLLALAGCHDLETFDDVGERDGLVAVAPRHVCLWVDDDDVLVRRHGVGLVNHASNLVVGHAVARGEAVDGKPLYGRQAAFPRTRHAHI